MRGESFSFQDLTLRILDLSLRVSSKLLERKRGESFSFQFWISNVARMGKRMEEEGGHAT
jgi:hypothetical protein